MMNAIKRNGIGNIMFESLMLNVLCGLGDTSFVQTKTPFVRSGTKGVEMPPVVPPALFLAGTTLMNSISSAYQVKRSRDAGTLCEPDNGGQP
jgi:hypothetical protein